MKHIPILFSTPMVQAILEGRKTQTRREIKPQPIIDQESGYVFDGKNRELYKNDIHHEDWRIQFAEDWCPYGQPGDILWVRENFRVIGWDWEDNEMTIEYENGDTLSLDGPDDQTWLANHVEKLRSKGVFKLSDPENEESSYVRTEKPHPLTPSIYMPKEACRIFLQVKSRRVERLQDISDQDAIAEGILEYEDGTYKNYFKKKGLREIDGVECLLPIGSFMSLFCSINGQEIWNKNPFVWVVEFEQVEKPENFI